MKKILYLITSSEYGGAQKYVHDLAINLPPTEYQAIVAAGQGDDELFKQLAGFPTVKTIKLAHLKRLPHPLTICQSLREIVQLLWQEKPDILHLNSSMAGFLGSWAGYIYKKKTKADLKIIYTVHGWVFLEPGFFKSRIYLLVEKLSAKWKDVLIVLSKNDLQIGLRKKIAPENKFMQIYNGLDFSALSFLDREEALKILPANFCQADRIVVVVIANFYPTKNLPCLIDGFKILSEKNQEAVLAIIGDGEQRKILEEKIKNYQLHSRVKLLGRTDKASQYLKAFDIFVLPSVKEGLPYVILEAMAAGLPIVATTVGGVPELIENEKSGLLVEPKNPIALAGAIEQLLNSPEQQKSLAQNAKQQAEKFGLGQMLNQTYLLY